MKKVLLVLTVVASMIVCTASAALASGIYLETLIGGNSAITFDGIGDEGDSKGFLIGQHSEVNSFVYGWEYLGGNWEFPDGTEMDVEAFTIEGGYRVYYGDIISLAIILGYYNQDILYLNFNSLMFGTNFAFQFSNKASLELCAAISLYGKMKMIGVDAGDAGILNYKIRFNYLITDHLGVSLGYHSYLTEHKDLSGTFAYNMDSFTAGILYKF
ncbi:MAG: hypothetical protein ACM3X6_11125 [Patescibacteria group bacterium]